MRSGKTLGAVIVGAALIAAVAPASAQQGGDAYRKYVACGTTQNAKPAHACPVGRAAPPNGKVGAFFRSNKADVFYKVCVKFPTGTPQCAAKQVAKKGRLYVNAITSTETGKHRVTWFVKGKRVGSFSFRLT